MISFSKFLRERQIPQVAAILLLLLLLGIGAVPGYLTGRWQWKQPPPVATLKELKEIQKKGLNLPGWQTVERQEQQVGGHKWSFQVIKKEGSPTQAILLLLPQRGPKDQPQVEWTDVNSSLQWDVAQERPAEFSIKQSASGSNTDIKVKARFFRGHTNQPTFVAPNRQTFAVLQWYAWADGGDPSPLRWFLSDQLAQWRQQRTPWVCVSILLPMEPLGKVETSWKEVQSIGETVQAALMAGFL
jgi:cyanoexosortase B-associated protein